MIVPQNDVAKLCILFVIDENWVILYTKTEHDHDRVGQMA
jgi:hypothetical protein